MAAPVTVPFAHSERSTVGIEWEVALVDADSGDLRQAAEAILAAVRPAGRRRAPADHAGAAAQHGRDPVGHVPHGRRGDGRPAARARRGPRRCRRRCAIELMGGGDAPVRQLGAAEGHRQAAVRHAHRPHAVVGPADADLRRARARRHRGPRQGPADLPARCSRCFAHIQSLSASSPFWGGRDTGYASNRALLFQQLPTAGLPFRSRTGPSSSSTSAT